MSGALQISPSRYTASSLTYLLPKPLTGSLYEKDAEWHDPGVGGYGGIGLAPGDVAGQRNQSIESADIEG